MKTDFDYLHKDCFTFSNVYQTHWQMIGDALQAQNIKYALFWGGKSLS